MTRPENPFEQLSYDLNKFRERRMAERRAIQRDTPDRRAGPQAPPPERSPAPDGGRGN